MRVLARGTTVHENDRHRTALHQSIQVDPETTSSPSLGSAQKGCGLNPTYRSRGVRLPARRRVGCLVVRTSARFVVATRMHTRTRRRRRAIAQGSWRRMLAASNPSGSYRPLRVARQQQHIATTTFKVVSPRRVLVRACVDNVVSFRPVRPNAAAASTPTTAFSGAQSESAPLFFLRNGSG